MLNKFKKARDEAIQELEHCDKETAYRIMKDIVMTSFIVGIALIMTLVIVCLTVMDHFQGKSIDLERIILLIACPIFTLLSYLVNRSVCGFFWDGFVEKHVLPSPENEDRQGIGQKDEKLP